MREVPECLQRRYQAVDQLIHDLCSDIAYQSDRSEQGSPTAPNYDPGIKIMCKFWNILKEDPDCNLQHTVQQMMAQKSWSSSSGKFGPHIACYQMSRDETPNASRQCSKEACRKSPNPSLNSTGASCCNKGNSCHSHRGTSKSPEGTKRSASPMSSSLGSCEPLSHALGTMKAAASVEKKCSEKAAELVSVQQLLTVQIAQLESKEKDEVKLLKEADAIWTKMENEYKEKLQASRQRQEELMKQHKQIEGSASKWRKNKKDLDEQMKNVDKCLQEIRYKYSQKKNDLKTIEMEISHLEKRIAASQSEVANESKLLEEKRAASAKRLEKIKEETRKLQVAKIKEDRLKQEKIAQGNECVKEAREELAKVCRVLLKTKLENEDLRAEAKALVDEIDLLKATFVQCGENCKIKEQSLLSEIEKYKSTVDELKIKTSKDHESTDTDNLKKYCMECPKCQEEMCDCGNDKCTDIMSECVCVTTKHKFMSNVFDNMYTVLERQTNTKAGKAVAEQVLDCLKNSCHGTLDADTRSILQNFILAVVKQNLNLTIIGGAVKTRCEMDAQSYQKLMLCLSKAVVEKPPKEDKGTDSRKEPCARWGGSDECNCPKGPDECVCTKEAPCTKLDEEDDEEDDIGEIAVCSNKSRSPCCPSHGIVPACYKKAKDSKDSKDTKETTDTKKGKNSCLEKACTFNSNMRAAQCSLGGDFMSNKTKVTKGRSNPPIIVIPSDFEPVKEDLCSCGSKIISMKCDCQNKSKKYKDHVLELLQKQMKIPRKTKFNNTLDNKNTGLRVTVLGQNGVKADLNAELARTSSGHMAMNVPKMSHVGEIASKECPIFVFKTSSSYKLVISKNNEKPNAVLIKHSSGEMNVVFKEISKFQEDETNNFKPKENLFYVRAKNTEAANQKTTLIKRTIDGNYEFVLDKEFETEYGEIINDYLDDNTYCYVNLFRTASGTYVIDFGEYDDNWENNNNALLAKSNPGGIELIVENPNMIIKRHSSIEESPRKFKNLYDKLLGSVEGYNADSIDSLKFYKNIKITIQDQEHLVAEVLVSLKPISPGQYSVIFNNKAEELFIGNLLNAREGRFLIEEATERGLKMYLNGNQESINQYGWLKLSPDGKILVVVDDKDTRGVGTDTYPEGCAGMYYKETGVTTTCHKKTDNCDCDTTKCICDELISEWDDWYIDSRHEHTCRSRTKCCSRKNSDGCVCSVCRCIR